MSGTVSFDEHDQFIYCHFTGPFELEPLINLARETNKFCLANGHNKILIDITKSIGEMKDFERFQHAAIISEFMSTSLKIALYARYDQILEDRLWQTATRNRMLKTKVFTEKHQAIEWLRSDSVV